MLDYTARAARPGRPPGGPAILESVASEFDGARLAEGRDGAVHGQLDDTGSLGAAAMLFVLARLLPQVEADHVGTFAFGPGVTVEWALLERA